MKIAMGGLAVLATVGGVVLIPKTTTWFDTFLEPTFEGSSVVVDPSTSLLWLGLALGAACGLAGIAVAYVVWVRNPAIAVRARERFAPVYRALRPQVVLRRAHRPARRAPVGLAGALRRGRPSSASSSTARSWAARPASCARARPRCGPRRTASCARYAALLVVGLVAVGLYFLLQA